MSSSSTVVYEGWMVRHGRNKIGLSFIHMRYVVLENRLLSYFERKPQRRMPKLPIKSLHIDANCRVEDRGLNMHQGHILYVLCVYNKRERHHKITMAAFNVQEALIWKKKIEMVIDQQQGVGQPDGNTDFSSLQQNDSIENGRKSSSSDDSLLQDEEELNISPPRFGLDVSNQRQENVKPETSSTRCKDLELLEHILDGREKPTNLPFTLMKNITENFSVDQEIGNGGFATVYKGVLPNGNVAVKRIRNIHTINETLFYREVDSLLNVEHKNVVRFLGFCASTEQIAIQVEGSREHVYAELRERLLCFEYINNGSLQKYITDELRGLEWNTRYEIIRGICEALHHMHKEKQIYHMDLKPENILLDNDMVPKITDFGLSRLDEKSRTMSKDRYGSLGYCAPEYLHLGKMSFKSDMYSLGVIIIELVTGEKAVPKNNNNVLRRWRQRWKKSGKETPLVYQQVAKCLEIGLLCREIEPSKRPFIWDMIHDIRQMEVVNEEICNANAYTFGQINSYPDDDDDMLIVEPVELHFPFELNKKMSCGLQLTNETDSYIAFNVQNMSPLSYRAQPQKGIMPPQSKCNVEITLQPQSKAPREMHRANEFTLWSTKVNDDLAIEDITTNMFIQGAVNVVDEVSLDVLFASSVQQEASGKT